MQGSDLCSLAEDEPEQAGNQSCFAFSSWVASVLEPFVLAETCVHSATDDLPQPASSIQGFLTLYWKVTVGDLHQ